MTWGHPDISAWHGHNTTGDQDQSHVSINIHKTFNSPHSVKCHTSRDQFLPKHGTLFTFDIKCTGCPTNTIHNHVHFKCKNINMYKQVLISTNHANTDF